MKSWQIFFFTLIPLALVFMGVVGGSFDGIDSELETFPTQEPRATATAGPAPTVVPGTTVLQLVGRNSLFDTDMLEAPANSAVVVSFDNQDGGLLHNFALYEDDDYSEVIFQGDIFAGPESMDYSFTAPAAGTYFFRCDVHPDTMTGTFTVR